MEIISDKNYKSLRIKKILLKKLSNLKINRPNLTVVIGGDGFMLQTLKKNKRQSKLFYGINSGNYGFLMNKFSDKHIIKNLISSKITTISPLEMIVISKGQTKKALAINSKETIVYNKKAFLKFAYYNSLQIYNVLK